MGHYYRYMPDVKFVMKLGILYEVRFSAHRTCPFEK